jgi:hypothetical protein
MANTEHLGILKQGAGDVKWVEAGECTRPRRAQLSSQNLNACLVVCGG